MQEESNGAAKKEDCSASVSARATGLRTALHKPLQVVRLAIRFWKKKKSWGR